MSRKFPNLGNRVRLNPITPSTAQNAVNIKNPEVIKEFDRQQRQIRQPDFKTIQISIETYKALGSVTEYFNMASYDDIIQTMVKHFRENVYREYGKYYDSTSD
ncbi:MAG: hypothetical protein MRJ93_00330 [Nitrososphaeraceae archaeon]|nr:hypothetical protein [Nitrososphaeraceae archaeon]